MISRNPRQQLLLFPAVAQEKDEQAKSDLETNEQEEEQQAETFSWVGLHLELALLAHEP